MTNEIDLDIDELFISTERRHKELSDMLYALVLAEDVEEKLKTWREITNKLRELYLLSMEEIGTVMELKSYLDEYDKQKDK